MVSFHAVSQQSKAAGQGGNPPSTHEEGANNKPSLADTEGWIKNTLAENTGQSICHEFDSSKQSGADYGPEFFCRSKSFELDFDGCKVTFYTFYSHRGVNLHEKPESNNGDDKADASIAEFNLRDIDPKTIQATDPYGTFGPLGNKTFHANSAQVDISLATTNSEETMTITHPNSPLSNKQFKLHALSGYVDNFVTVQPDYAPRFVKALTHAVELCGGKTSAF